MKTEAIITLSLAPPESKSQVSEIGFPTAQNTKILTDSNTFYQKRITGEPDLVKLDGSYRFYEPPDDCCYSTLMSGADCRFNGGNALVSLSVSFSQPQKSRGISLYFGDTCAADFGVYWYGDSAQKASKAVKGNTSNPCIVTLDQDIEYDHVLISISKTDKPYRYIKLTEIDFGETITYNTENLLSANLHEEVDISGSSAPASTLKMSIYDPDQQLNPANSGGLYYRLLRGMQIRAEMVMDGISEPGGIYYLDTWEGSQTSISKLTAINCLGYFKGAEPEHESRFYTDEPPTTVLSDFGDVLCANLAADNLPISSLTGYIPRKTVREALCQLCTAVGGYPVITRDGTLKIRALSLDPYDPVELSQDDVFGEPAAEAIKRSDGFEIEYSEYKIGAETRGFGHPQSPYYGPMPNYVVYETGGIGYECDAISGCEVESKRGLWSCKIYYNRVEYTYGRRDGCDIMVFGHAVTTTKYTTAADAGSSNVVSIKDIPLITAANYDIVRGAATDYCARNLKLKFKMRLPQNLTCGALVTVPTKYGGITGNISSMDIDLTGGMLANVEVLAHVAEA